VLATGGSEWPHMLKAHASHVITRSTTIIIINNNNNDDNISLLGL
jgi:hypothetical protein